jgi:F0F1-type ATP synthase alpha subunit
MAKTRLWPFKNWTQISPEIEWFRFSEFHSTYLFLISGFLDKVDPSRITDFEKKFLEHVKATQRPLLDQIAKDGHLSPASDQSLNKVVKEFLSTF